MWRSQRQNPREKELLRQWQADKLRLSLQELPLRLLLWKLRSSMEATPAASRGPMAWCLARLKRLLPIGRKTRSENALPEPLPINSSLSLLRFLPPCLVRLWRRILVKVLCLVLDSLKRRLSRGIQVRLSRSSKK